jgi:ferritin-like metal-binding protein YciE
MIQTNSFGDSNYLTRTPTVFHPIMTRTNQEQLVHFLSDMYSVEQQAIAQLVSAAPVAGDPALSAAIQAHEKETEEHAVLVGERLEAYGEEPAVLKNAIMKLGGKGFAAFAAVMPETPGRLVAHAYSYEAMEWAGYEMLARFAQDAGDLETLGVAQTIGGQERRMMQRLEESFDIAEEASHRDTPPEKMASHVRTHLNEAHALESQAIKLLGKSEKIAGESALASACAQNLQAAQKHAQLLEERLAALGSSSSTVKDVVLGLGGLNWGFFFQAQSDTPAKLAAFAYAFEHLKIACYQLLLRSARRAGDPETQRLCETLIADEQSMAGRLAATFSSAAEATPAVAGGK